MQLLSVIWIIAGCAAFVAATLVDDEELGTYQIRRCGNEPSDEEVEEIERRFAAYYSLAGEPEVPT
ncbi:SubName: Full=Uncharacterized protein {ECO:0000313/EMBL:CCA68062.1} [Serendipita indica DSM 11827]|nr:SubName: Full=Uncharacterized protein {ECO:0000313/EMBL:CCA68062.1} [Serendipita indica DSM 11827]